MARIGFAITREERFLVSLAHMSAVEDVADSFVLGLVDIDLDIDQNLLRLEFERYAENKNLGCTDFRNSDLCLNIEGEKLSSEEVVDILLGYNKQKDGLKFTFVTSKSDIIRELVFSFDDFYDLSSEIHRQGNLNANLTVLKHHGISIEGTWENLNPLDQWISNAIFGPTTEFYGEEPISLPLVQPGLAKS